MISALGFKARVDLSLTCFLACASFLRFSTFLGEWSKLLMLIICLKISFHLSISDSNTSQEFDHATTSEFIFRVPSFLPQFLHLLN